MPESYVETDLLGSAAKMGLIWLVHLTYNAFFKILPVATSAWQGTVNQSSRIELRLPPCGAEDGEDEPLLECFGITKITRRLRSVKLDWLQTSLRLQAVPAYL